jgi:hypothetical protein
LIPGSFFSHSEEMVHIGKVMPSELRGWDLQTAMSARHAELLGGAGLALIYFGGWGPIIAGLWGFSCAAIYNRIRSAEGRLMLLVFPVTTLFIAGEINTVVMQLSNLALVLGSAMILLRLCKHSRVSKPVHVSTLGKRSPTTST